ncbi:hypothetical protein K445DRAFT_313162 [Daldinia sp. EC12]|nr:hypothetical protein K445DRAFT_313162 [Daldinia sp. EC12]
MSEAEESPPEDTSRTPSPANVSLDPTVNPQPSYPIEPSASDTNLSLSPSVEPSLPSAMQTLRRPGTPTYNLDSRLTRYVYVYHPYYPMKDDYNPMLQFLTTDDGAQYLMIYYACCILAGNCTKPDEGRDMENSNSPFLSTSPKVENRLEIPANDIIPHGNYYFIVPDPTDTSPTSKGQHYPVTPTFDDWKPPETVPPPWVQVEVPLPAHIKRPAEYRAAEPCYLSKVFNGVEQAHIIPRSEERWVTISDIKSSLDDGTQDVLSDWRNKIPLRKDLHFLWDHGYLTFFPKTSRFAPPKQYVLAIHVSRKTPNPEPNHEIIRNYHNTIVANMYGVPAKFLYIRFAWSIFNEDAMQLFKKKKKKFLVRYLVPLGDNNVEEKTDTLTHASICRHRSGSSRLYSPRFKSLEEPGSKRPRTDSVEDEYFSSDVTEDGCPSSYAVSLAGSTCDYDWVTDEASGCDDSDSSISLSIGINDDTRSHIPSDEINEDEIVELRKKNNQSEKVRSRKDDDCYPVKRQRSSVSNVDSKESTDISLRQSREERCSSLPSFDQPTTPDC